MNKSLSIVLIVGAIALLGMIFYNYTSSGKINYTGITIAILYIFISVILSRQTRSKS
jgi:hypothetical protein